MRLQSEERKQDITLKYLIISELTTQEELGLLLSSWLFNIYSLVVILDLREFVQHWDTHVAPYS